MCAPSNRRYKDGNPRDEEYIVWLLSTTEMAHSQLPYFPHQQLSYNDSQVNAALKNGSGGGIK